SSGNGKSPTSISKKLPLINCGNSGKKLVSVSTMLPTNNNEDLGVEPASTSTLVPVNNNKNLGKRIVKLLKYKQTESWLHQGWEELRNSQQSNSAKLKLQSKVLLVFLEMDPGRRAETSLSSAGPGQTWVSSTMIL
ncbi:hypothetical protein MKW98_027430, partial [Papaver atlanticum]